MKLNQIASKPQLIQLSVSDEDILKEYGEELEFHTWDRQPLDIFMKLAAINQENQSEMLDIVRTLILDENGTEIIKDGVTLPSVVLIKVIAKVVETLGK
jgi:hypothetical protein